MSNPFENEKVSVIIPVYNSEKYLSRTIDSVLKQSYVDIEIIIVDDCSTDNSAIIINHYLKRYANIKYHLLEKNCGVAVARNKGIEIAEGRYIAFIDSDDVWYPHKIERQLELMEYHRCAICYTAIEMIDENDVLIKGKRNVIEKINYQFLLKNTMLATSSVVIDRALSGEFQMTTRRIGEDYATWLWFLRNGYEAYGINEALVKYRKSKGTLSSKKFKNVLVVMSIQIKEEGINPIGAAFNCIFYVFNALKKHYL